MSLHVLIHDIEDLTIASAHLADAVTRCSAMQFQEDKKRFICMFNTRDTVQTGIHFEYVDRIQTSGFSKDYTENLTCIAIIFESTQAPSGIITLFFEDNLKLRLFVECLDGHLKALSSPLKAAESE